MEIKEKKQLRAKAKVLEPVVRMGKNGLTDAIIKEIKKQLSKRKLIKIKLLKSVENRKELAKQIADKTGGELIESVGFVVVLYKRNIYKKQEQS
ncbi:YhbY family RNA-binding protein [Nanoarchaeota archaeon]